jgi:hemoglobin-like flavoprotein
LIEENLAVVSEAAPDVVARFYTKLFERHPELKALFGRRSSAAQEKMVLDAIIAVVDHMEDAAWLKRTLRPLGAKHVTYGVTEHMYPLVADALVATLREASGASWNGSIEAAWSGALTAVAIEMIAGAREAEAAPTSRRGAAAVPA